MKKFMILAAAVSVSAIAAPAAAQTVTGTVVINGHVDPKCFVSPGGTGSDAFAATVDLGELAASTGTLATDLATRFNTTTSGSLSAKVICTSANPTIAVEAQPIKAQTSVATAGYADTVTYRAKVDVVTIAANASPYTDVSDATAGVPVALGSRLANQATNITISADNFATALPTDLLVADPSYMGKIIVTIAPGA